MTPNNKPPRTCPVKGCGVVMNKHSLLLCPAHWNLVPKDLKNEVWRYYRPGQDRKFVASREYVVAAEKAIEHLEREERLAAACGTAIQGNLI